MKIKCTTAILVSLFAVLATTGIFASPRRHGKGDAPSPPSKLIPFLNQPLVPTSAAPGGSTFTLTVNGTSFVPGANVNWNGSPRATTFVSSSQLTAQIAAGDISTAGSASVTATNPGGIPSNPMYFQVAFPATTVNFSRSDVPVGVGPTGVVTGDFNGDGKLDLAANNYQGGSISILIGNGDGTFTPASAIPVSSGYFASLTGDFNGDGNLDLATANALDSKVSIILGNGDGTFQAPINLAYAGSPISIASADVNGDGNLDLIVGNLADSSVSIILGNGDGTFQPATDFPVGGVPFSVGVGDFNGDGRIDLAVIDGTGVAILLGNGDGTFGSPVEYPAANTQLLAVADFNNDGILDVAAAPNLTGGVDILLGNGDGTFQPAVSYSTNGAVGVPVAGDFNGDSKLDLVFCDGGNSGGVHLLLGNGDGTFQPPLVFPSFPVAGDLVAGDFNRDGLLDVALADESGTTVSIALQTSLVVSPLFIDFGGQGVLTTSLPQSITLTNIGAAAIPINSITITGPNADVFGETSACGNSLAAGATCTLSVTFTPKNKHNFTATLNIFDGAIGSPQQIALSGTGAFARYIINPAGLHFGSQTVGTTSNPKTLKLTVRAFALAITSISVGGANSSDFAETNNCTPVVQPGSFCAINVTFTPSGTGTRSAKVVLKGGFEFGPISVPVQGTGTN